MASQALELSIEALRARRGTKWHRYPDDVLGAWVADMDFRVAEPVEAAIRRVVDEGDYGYGARQGEQGLAAAFTVFFEHLLRDGIEPPGGHVCLELAIPHVVIEFPEPTAERGQLFPPQLADRGLDFRNSAHGVAP